MEDGWYLVGTQPRCAAERPELEKEVQALGFILIWSYFRPELRGDLTSKLPYTVIY